MNTSKKFSWTKLEHHHIERSTDWYWAIGVVAIAIAILSVFFGNYLFALVILLGTFVIFLSKHTRPIETNFEINRKGVVVGTSLYPYSNLESFWVEEDTDPNQIRFKSKKLLMPFIILPLPDNVNPDDIRDYLLDYLDEEELEESVIQIFFEKLLM